MAEVRDDTTAQPRELPEHDAAREWLESMMLIRRFEERAGEMYAKAKVGGFLHLAIGEEATIVGACRAMRDDDYLISTYRSHGHALARGSDPNRVMAELFGRQEGVSHGRGGSMHMFDLENRFMGGYGVPGLRCDGMDVVETHHVLAEAIRRAREDRQPILVEAITYRFRGHSMADPEEYRTKEQVAEWRKRDPIAAFGNRLVREGVLEEGERERLDREAVERVDAAVAFADASPHPSPNALYDDIYVLGDQVRGWYSVDERTPTPHRGEDERAMDSADLPRDEHT